MLLGPKKGENSCYKIPPSSHLCITCQVRNWSLLSLQHLESCQYCHSGIWELMEARVKGGVVIGVALALELDAFV